MNVTFICRTLEVGKCGVGDYTRKLAAELIRQGHRVGVIALRDFYVNEVVTESQEDRGVQIPVLRFPLDTKWSIQSRRIQAFLAQQETQWLSLQYVPYSFHGKGLHWARNAFFEDIGKGKRWHIMFHELWLGLSKEASLKRVLWGAAQQLCLLDLVKKLKPASVHTHSRVYQAVLTYKGIAAQQLPLFSNIDPSTGANPVNPPSNELTFALFASIRKTSKREQFLKELETENNKRNRTARILFLGRAGQLKEQWKQSIKDKNSISYEDLGVLDAPAVSRHLSSADIALSFNPMLLTEKSGTVACYWAHHLPVLSLADEWNTRKDFQLENPKGVVAYQKGSLHHFLDNYTNLTNPYKDSIEIAAQFVDQTIGAVDTIKYQSNNS